MTSRLVGYTVRWEKRFSCDYYIHTSGDIVPFTFVLPCKDVEVIVKQCHILDLPKPTVCPVYDHRRVE
jgi:hypothetical protein